MLKERICAGEIFPKLDLAQQTSYVFNKQNHFLDKENAVSQCSVGLDNLFCVTFIKENTEL